MLMCMYAHDLLYVFVSERAGGGREGKGRGERGKKKRNGEREGLKYREEKGTERGKRRRENAFVRMWDSRTAIGDNILSCPH